MANLTVTLLGLNRSSTSIGLALRRYMTKGGKHTFTIIGHDFDTNREKLANKMGATDRSEHRPERAVEGADLVVMAMSYEEVEATYNLINASLRPGAVILDMSPLKRPSLDWADKYLSEDHHLVGFTPILNPRYLFNSRDLIEEAEEDLFDDSAILLTPAASCAKEAVDLAFNFSAIVGSKPRFLDPLEHDTMLAKTVHLPQVLGTVLFYHLQKRENWDDLRWFTNPDFGVLTRPLFDIHPDALRDQFVGNADALGRALDDYIGALQEMRDILQDGDRTSVEAIMVQTSKDYEAWINSRYRADWDAPSRGPEPKGGTMLQGLLGGALADRLAGKKDDDRD